MFLTFLGLFAACVSFVSGVRQTT